MGFEQGSLAGRVELVGRTRAQRTGHAVGILHRSLPTGTIGPVAIHELDRHVDYAIVANLETLVDPRGEAVAIAVGVLTPLGLNRAFHIIFEHDVNDAGDRVGTVLGGRAVAQHFNALDRADRNGVQVGARSATTNRGVDMNQGATVPAPTVYQDQYLVRAHAAQGGGSNRVCPVADG